MKRILDACCGSRMFWFDKQNPEVDFCDNRSFTETLNDGRILKVEPDILVDFTALPFEDESYFLVVFDPPHLLKVGENSWMAKKYGRLESNFEKTIKLGFDECLRVLKPNGTLVFKWSETDIPVSQVIRIIEHDPLFGHKSGKSKNTHWLCFMK